MTAFQLQKASNHLFQGLNIVNEHIGNLSADRIPKIVTSAKNLNPNSSMYELQKKSLDQLVLQTQSEMTNLMNIISSTTDGLKTASNNVRTLGRQVQKMQAEHEWANAGSCKRAYLVAASTLKGVANFVTTPVRFLNENRGVVAIGLAAAGGMAAGYFAAQGMPSFGSSSFASSSTPHMSSGPWR